MEINKTRIKRRRNYSQDFKRKLVEEFEKGTFTVQELSKLYKIQSKVIYRWIYKFSHYQTKNIQIVEMKESSTQKVKKLEKRIKELERIVGQKQINIDYLEKMIDITKEEIGVDIRKKYDTSQSNGSEAIKKS